MKTPESISGELGRRGCIITIEEIKAIQLDAWRKGMSDAAEIAYPLSIRSFRTKEEQIGCNIRQAILTARDNKQSL
jgi:hypothetical protein